MRFRIPTDPRARGAVGLGFGAAVFEAHDVMNWMGRHPAFDAAILGSAAGFYWARGRLFGRSRAEDTPEQESAEIRSLPAAAPVRPSAYVVDMTAEGKGVARRN